MTQLWERAEGGIEVDSQISRILLLPEEKMLEFYSGHVEIEMLKNVDTETSRRWFTDK